MHLHFAGFGNSGSRVTVASCERRMLRSSSRDVERHRHRQTSADNAHEEIAHARRWLRLVSVPAELLDPLVLGRKGSIRGDFFASGGSYQKALWDREAMTGLTSLERTPVSILYNTTPCASAMPTIVPNKKMRFIIIFSAPKSKAGFSIRGSRRTIEKKSMTSFLSPARQHISTG